MGSTMTGDLVHVDVVIADMDRSARRQHAESMAVRDSVGHALYDWCEAYVASRLGDLIEGKTSRGEIMADAVRVALGKAMETKR
jgi:hypothetical protein